MPSQPVAAASSRLAARRRGCRSAPLCASILIACFLASTLASQEPALLADLAPGPGFPQGTILQPVALGDRVVFSGGDQASGQELWISDGSAGGAHPLRDIQPGSRGSFPFELTSIGSKVFFVAYQEVHSTEVWVTDGTAVGTRRLADLCPRVCESVSFRQLASLGDRVVLRGDYSTQRAQLWVSDGSPAGTHRLQAIDADGRDPSELTRAGERIFYTDVPNRPDATGSDRALWVTDGTRAGTVQVTSPGFGGPGSRPHGLMARGDDVLFLLDQPGGGLELWTSDGAAAGTRRVAELDPHSMHVERFGWTQLGSETYFVTVEPSRESPSAPSLGRLWVSDGSAAGTRLIADLTALAGPADPFLFPVFPRELVAAGGRVFFRFATSATGPELWTSDGTTAGTRVVRELAPGPLAGSFGSLTDFAGALYFLAIDFDSSRPGLWTSDGTGAGTREILRFPGAWTNFYPDGGIGIVDDRLYFAGTDPSAGVQLWTSDGTAAGTRPVADLGPTWSSGDPQQLLGHRERGYFTARSVERVEELWTTDATSSGTEVLLPSEVSHQRTWGLTASGPHVFFLRDNPNLEEGLWRTAGSAADTLEVERFLYAFEPEAFGSGVCLTGGTESTGGELHCTNADASAAPLVADLALGTYHDVDLGETPRSSFPSGLTPIGNRLFFIAFDDNVPSLWVSDGTRSGTRRLSVSAAGEEIAYPSSPIRVGERLFFLAHGPGLSLQLWVTEGDTASTRPVAMLTDERRRDGVRAMFELRGRLALVLDPFIGEPTLWLSDGTPAGTGAVSTIPWPQAATQAYTSTVVVGGDLFFVGDHPDTGFELWATDGTAAGTRLVKDILPGAGDSFPLALRSIGSLLLFSASDGAGGHEPWVSDGTEAGTRRLADLVPGAGSSDPAHFEPVADRVFFAAHHPDAGRELWYLERSALVRRCTPGGERLCLGEGRFEVIVDWLDPRSGARGRATPVPYGDDTGFQWFFRDDNLEILLKVLDGSAVNGHAWVFHDGLTDVAYWLTVTDLETGASKTYASGPGHRCGVADTRAFALGTSGEGAAPGTGRGNPAPTRNGADPTPGDSTPGTRMSEFGSTSAIRAATPFVIPAEAGIQEGGRSALGATVSTPGTRMSEFSTPGTRVSELPVAVGAGSPRPLPGEAPATALGRAGSCIPDATTLCLLGGRFALSLEWRDQRRPGREGQGRAVPGTDRTGFFWFFRDGNLELMVKALDGRPVNGRFWIFYGSLTDVEFDLTVTDTVTGAVKTYRNPPGELCGRTDTAAFEP